MHRWQCYQVMEIYDMANAPVSSMSDSDPLALRGAVQSADCFWTLSIAFSTLWQKDDADTSAIELAVIILDGECVSLQCALQLTFC